MARLLSTIFPIRRADLKLGQAEDLRFCSPLAIATPGVVFRPDKWRSEFF
jgi:hypothetical protein